MVDVKLQYLREHANKSNNAKSEKYRISKIVLHAILNQHNPALVVKQQHLIKQVLHLSNAA